MVKFVPDYFKTQEICENVVKKLLLAIIHVQISIRLKKSVKKLFQKILVCCNLFAIAKKLKNM